MAGPDANFFNMVIRQHEQKAARKERQRDRTIRTIQGAAQTGMQAAELGMRMEEFEAKKKQRETLGKIEVNTEMFKDSEGKSMINIAPGEKLTMADFGGASGLNSVVQTMSTLKNMTHADAFAAFVASLGTKPNPNNPNTVPVIDRDVDGMSANWDNVMKRTKEHIRNF